MGVISTMILRARCGNHSFSLSPILLCARQALTTRFKVLQSQQITIRRMCFYSSEEEDEPDHDYLLFRSLLNTGSPFAAKETVFFRNMITRDPTLLREEGTVWNLIHGVVVPNILIRPEDEELFESDYRGFINREMDLESRRTGACILFGRMVIKCEEARDIYFQEVIKLVDSRNWKEKECGILLAATMVCSPTALFDTKPFARRRILKLLHLYGFPMLKATALRFLTVAAQCGRVTITWRADVMEASFLMLQENSNVVQSYASICLRILFLDRDSSDGLDEAQRKLFLDRDSSDGHDEALANLFLALQKSEYNPYIMHCIYQVLSVSEISDKVGDLCFSELTYLLSQSCQTSQNAEFNENVLLSLTVLIQRAPHHEVTQERLIHLLGIFQDLVSSPITEEHGFHAVIQNLDYYVIAPYMEHFWNALFTLFADQVSVEFQKAIVISMSLFLVSHGTDRLVDTVNSVHPGIFIAFLIECWTPNLKLITGTNEIKLTTVASTSLICESQALLDPSTDRLCGEMLDSLLQLVSNNEQQLSENVAAKTGKDPLTDIEDPLHYLCTSLSTVSPDYRGRYKEIIDKYLSQDNHAYLSKLCARYNCDISKEEGVNEDGEKTE